MEIKFKCDINPTKIVAKITDSKKLWKTAHAEWWRLISPYTPFQTGNLMSKVSINSERIKYKSPYAHHAYMGENLDFRKDKHPLASARWSEAATPSQLPKLAETLRNYIRSEILK